MIAEKPVVRDEVPTPVKTPEPEAKKGKSRVLGVLFGVFLFFFAGFHAGPGMQATSSEHGQIVVWSATVGWLVAAGALVLAAYGLWGFPGFTKRWRGLACAGAVASLITLLASAQWSMWPLMVLDVAILSIAIDSDPLQLPAKRRGIVKRFAFFLVRVLALAFWVYGAGVVVLRPWHRNWGASAAEIERKMPDDPAYRGNLINHVVTVNAPAGKVWPWMIQLGQDKAGFYSYDNLERAIGDDIHNVLEIRPEWQHLQVGDFVRATQPDYMGGRWKDEAGWHVTAVEPGKSFTLQNWGTFWVEPAGAGKSRFGVRTEVGSVPFWWAPAEVFGFEPMHFIMEQKTLVTIKECAERGS